MNDTYSSFQVDKEKGLQFFMNNKIMNN